MCKLPENLIRELDRCGVRVEVLKRNAPVVWPKQRRKSPYPDANPVLTQDQLKEYLEG